MKPQRPNRFKEAALEVGLSVYMAFMGYSPIIEVPKLYLASHQEAPRDDKTPRQPDVATMQAGMFLHARQKRLYQ